MTGGFSHEVGPPTSLSPLPLPLDELRLGFAMGCCSSRVPTPTTGVLLPPATPFTLEALAGKWYVLYTNLDMWTPTKNVRPTITYTLQAGQPGTLLDVVDYASAGGAAKSVVGVDTQHSEHASVFRWRGAGMLKCITSSWQVAACDPACASWAVTAFEATPFTKEGVDVRGMGDRGGLVRRCV